MDTRVPATTAAMVDPTPHGLLWVGPDQTRAVGPDQVITPNLLKEEARGLCWAISSKRYALFSLGEDGEVTFVVSDPDGKAVEKFSEHGLGHLLNPLSPESYDEEEPDEDSETAEHNIPTKRDFARELWRYMIEKDALAREAPDPAWLDKLEVLRFTGSSPHLMRPFMHLDSERPYSERIKPFNFLVALTTDESVPGDVRLIAPYESDPERWWSAPWRDIRTGKSMRPVLGTLEWGGPSSSTVPMKTLRNTLANYRNHPEASLDGPDGRPCAKQTIGLLQRRTVRIASVTHIGKEANKLEERQVVSDFAPNDFGDGERSTPLDLFLAVLSPISNKELASRSGISEREVRAIRREGAKPHPTTFASLRKVACEVVGVRVVLVGEEWVPASPSWMTRLVEWAKEHPSGLCRHCGKPLGRRGRVWCSARCKKAGQRAQRGNAHKPLDGRWHALTYLGTRCR